MKLGGGEQETAPRARMFIYINVKLARSTSVSRYVASMFFMNYSCFLSAIHIYFGLWCLEDRLQNTSPPRGGRGAERRGNAIHLLPNEIYGSQQ